MPMGVHPNFLLQFLTIQQDGGVILLQFSVEYRNYVQWTDVWRIWGFFSA